MTRFFFDICDSEGFHRDEEGHDLPAREEASEEALATLGSIVHDELRMGRQLDGDDFAVEVRDESGHMFFVAKLSLSSRWAGKGTEPRASGILMPHTYVGRAAAARERAREAKSSRMQESWKRLASSYERLAEQAENSRNQQRARAGKFRAHQQCK